MATIINILVTPTYDKNVLGITDISVYSDGDPASAAIEITPPGFDAVSIVFNINVLNTFTSETLEITAVDATQVALPDGVYIMTYSIVPADAEAITKYVMRIEQLQEKFDAAFMKLDMMECDRAIKAQAKVELNTIYFFMQGAVSAANNCAIDEANKLYISANRMLDSFIRSNCGCSGSNYVVTYT